MIDTFKDKTVLLDCDGVLLDFTARLKYFLALEFGGKERNITNWDLKQCLSPVEEGWARYIFKQECFWEGLKPIEGAVEGVKRLKQISKKVLIVTSPYIGVPRWHHIRCQAMKKLFSINAADVTLTMRKHRFKGHVFIDDKPSNVEMWQKCNPQHLAIAYKQPYNDGTFTWKSFLEETA